MRVIGAVLAAGLALPVAAEEITSVARVYDRVVVFPVEAGFVGAFEDEQDGRYLLELVPEGESVEDWSQMITLSGNRGLAVEIPDPLQMASAIGAGFQQACPDSYQGSDEGAQEVAGAEAAHLVMFSCGDLGGYAERALILVALSGADVFTLQWAERGPVEDASAQPDPALWLPRGAALLGLRFCPVIDGEEPPYPSCIE